MLHRMKTAKISTGAKDDSTVASLWIWLAGTAILTIPAVGNFFRMGL